MRTIQIVKKQIIIQIKIDTGVDRALHQVKMTLINGDLANKTKKYVPKYRQVKGLLFKSFSCSVSPLQGMDPESLMFRDGRRKIDMIICYEEENEGVMTELEAKRRESRRVFQENLIKDGLEIEFEDNCQSFDEKTCFIKIHLPWRSEIRYAEVLNLKLPVKRFITISVKAWVKYRL